MKSKEDVKDAKKRMQTIKNKLQEYPLTKEKAWGILNNNFTGTLRCNYLYDLKVDLKGNNKEITYTCWWKCCSGVIGSEMEFMKMFDGDYFKVV